MYYYYYYYYFGGAGELLLILPMVCITCACGLLEIVCAGVTRRVINHD